MKWEVRIVRPPYHDPPPVASVSSRELEKVLSTIECFLNTEYETPYTEGYILLRKDLEEKLKDCRFSRYPWWIRKYQAVLHDDLCAIADRARVDLQAVLKFRQ